MVRILIDFIISVFKETQVNTWIIISVLILGYLYREGISNFFSEKLLEKQKLHDEQRDVKQNEFQEKLLKQNAELQKSVLAAIENQILYLKIFIPSLIIFPKIFISVKQR